MASAIGYPRFKSQTCLFPFSLWGFKKGLMLQLCFRYFKLKAKSQFRLSFFPNLLRNIVNILLVSGRKYINVHLQLQGDFYLFIWVENCLAMLAYFVLLFFFIILWLIYIAHSSICTFTWRKTLGFSHAFSHPFFCRIARMYIQTWILNSLRLNV